MMNNIRPKLNELADEDHPSKPSLERKQPVQPVLQQFFFIWDSIILVIASTIFALSVSGIVIEFFKSDTYTLACFSQFESRAQYTYINNYCFKHVPIEEYFGVAMMLHTAALVVPHYLWRTYFSAKINYFFAQASKLETLRNRQTGKYPSNNYYIVQSLKTYFGNKKAIVHSYVAKLCTQFLLIFISGGASWYVFNSIDANITFDCYDYNERSQLFGNVTCAFPRKLFINVLKVADYSLLAVAIIATMIGLLWRFIVIEDEKTAKFCFDSGIDPKIYYHNFHNWKPLKKWLWLCQMNDFRFLLTTLWVTNCGFKRVFEAILIEDAIFQKFVSTLADYQGGHIIMFYFSVSITNDNYYYINCRNW